jgi:hypothetical protein
MMAAFNSHERTAKEWRALIEGADHRLELSDIILSRESALAFFEVRWSGKE